MSESTVRRIHALHAALTQAVHLGPDHLQPADRIDQIEFYRRL